MRDSSRHCIINCHFSPSILFSYLKHVDQKHIIQVQSKGQNEKSSGVRRYTIVVNVKYIILTDNNSTTAFNMELILMCKINKELNIRFVVAHYSLEF